MAMMECDNVAEAIMLGASAASDHQTRPACAALKDLSPSAIHRDFRKSSTAAHDALAASGL